MLGALIAGWIVAPCASACTRATRRCWTSALFHSGGRPPVIGAVIAAGAAELFSLRSRSASAGRARRLPRLGHHERITPETAPCTPSMSDPPPTLYDDIDRESQRRRLDHGPPGDRADPARRTFRPAPRRRRQGGDLYIDAAREVARRARSPSQDANRRRPRTLTAWSTPTRTSTSPATASRPHVESAGPWMTTPPTSSSVLSTALWHVHQQIRGRRKACHSARRVAETHTHHQGAAPAGWVCNLFARDNSSSGQKKVSKHPQHRMGCPRPSSFLFIAPPVRPRDRKAAHGLLARRHQLTQRPASAPRSRR